MDHQERKRSMPLLRKRPWSIVSLCVFAASLCIHQGAAFAEGEPAENFLKRLRAANYFDSAIAYLERVEKYPGIDPEFVKAIPLEKAQTFIDLATRGGSGDRDKYLDQAEAALSQFAKVKEHPRFSEAQMRLGSLQQYRGSQIMAKSDLDAEQKQLARKHLSAATQTYDATIADLKAILKTMQGQKVDAAKDPEKAALRDTYQYHYLQAQLKAGETRVLTAEAFEDPAKEAKPILDEALKRFSGMADKYSGYSQGAESTYYIGKVHELLGDKKKALTFYNDMVEAIDADPLREAKFKAATGLVNLHMGDSPPKFAPAIKAAQPLVKGIRPNEKMLPSVQDLRIALAKAYLAKSNDKENQKPTDMKRALSDGRTLLTDASKVAGPHLEETKELLATLGVSTKDVELPTAKPPKNLGEAIESARTILAATKGIDESLALLEKEKETAELKTQIENLGKQLRDNYSIGTQILRAGLGMANSRSDIQLLNQARQILTFTLYRQKLYRDTVVVGGFLARSSPGTDPGLAGGLMALSSLQQLLADVPSDENEGLILQLEKLGDFLNEKWPGNPDAAKAQGFRIQLLIQKDDYDGAKALITEMKDGPEKAAFRRLLGQLLYNQSIKLRFEKETPQADALLADAEKILVAGLNALPKNLIPGEALQAALVLARVFQDQGKSAEALKILDHPNYGPLTLIDKQGPPTKRFSGDLYSLAIKVLFAEMIAAKDPEPMLKRSSGVMEKLRAAYPGKDGAEKLNRIYVRMAQDLSKELQSSPPDKKAKLIKVFRVFLKRVTETTKDEATLNWAAQTLMVMGKEAMKPGETKATGDAAELIESAAELFKGLMGEDLSKRFQYAQALRLSGQYKTSLAELEAILKKNQMMLDAQIEAAVAYELWAGEQKTAKIASRVYNAALSGGRPAANGKNVIWGWGLISKQTNGKAAYREKFFDARYHVGLCRYLEGKKLGDKKIMAQAIRDITQIEALYPDMGGAKQRAKFDALLKEIQKAVGDRPTGLKPPPKKAA